MIIYFSALQKPTRPRDGGHCAVSDSTLIRRSSLGLNVGLMSNSYYLLWLMGFVA